MDKAKFNEVLDFAIEQEQAAFDFYSQLAEQASDQHVKQTLLDFANQERGHKAKLEAIKQEQRTLKAPSNSAPDLQISDYLVDVEPTANLSFQGALILAMKKEKSAYRLYRDLANSCGEDNLRQVFLFLAHEEANHKLSFELQYDDLIYQEN